jgi:predicted LPLAT superfamily acyltransferase
MPSWKGKSRGGVSGYKFFIFILTYFGISVAYFFLRFVIVYFIIFSPKATKAIWLYLRNIHKYSFGKCFIKLFQNYYIFGQTLIDKIAILGGFEKKFTYSFDNYDNLLTILDANLGCVLISAHIGNWEVAGQFFGNYGNKLNIFMLEAEHERIKNLLSGILGDKNYNIIGLKEDLSHIIKINNALSNKEYICFQGDRYVNINHTMKAMFMGKEVLFPDGPFKISARYNVPVVFFFAMKDSPRKYSFHFFPATQVNPEVPQTKDERAKALLGEYVSVFSAVLKKYPEQWFNYYNFWDNKTS